MEGSLQVGKTRYTHYSLAYHLVWIPKDRRRIVVGEVQAETKRLITECCERQGLTLLAVETDQDYMHVFVSAPPRFSPAMIANLWKRIDLSFCTREVSPSQKDVWKGTSLDTKLVCWHGGRGFCQDEQTVHSRKSGQVVQLGAGRFHPIPWNGVGLLAPSVKMRDRYFGPSVLYNITRLILS
jgi:REP element-mobilizing transposase RayT